MNITLLYRLFICAQCLLWLWPGITAAQSGNAADSLYVSALIKEADRAFVFRRYDSVLYYADQLFNYSQPRGYRRGELWSHIKRADALLEKDSIAAADKLAGLIIRDGRVLKDSGMVGIGYVLKGEGYLYREKLDSAILFFEIALSKRLENIASPYTGLCYNELGYAWGRKGREDRMIEFCLKGFQVYESMGNAYGAAMTLGNIATSYGSLGEEQKAISYSTRSFAYREKVGDLEAMALTACNLSGEYMYVNLDSAAKYQRRCLECALASGSKKRLANAYTTAALVANEQGKPQDAFDFELKAVELLEETRFDDWLLASRYMTTAFYAEKIQKDSLVILSYYDKAIKLAEQLNSKNSLQNIYRFRAGFYRRKNDYEKAYDNYKKFVLYKDSLSLEDQKRNVDELEARYQTAKKDGEIELLNGEKKIKLLQIEKQRAVINSDRLLDLQREGEISLLTQQQQLRLLELEKNKEIIALQQLEAKTKEQQRLIAEREQEVSRVRLQAEKRRRNGMVAGSALLLLIAGIGFSRYQLKKKLEQQTALQEIRNNIASDLHDDIGASLSNIHILNELTRRHAGQPEKVQEYLGKAAEDIRHVSEGVSDIVWNINPRYDSLDQLFIRMKRYAADVFDSMNIHYSLNFPENAGNHFLDMNRRRDFYLLFKDAVNNLAKHSKATHASVEISIGPHQIGLLIEDNGVGFDGSAAADTNGLHTIEQRAKLLNGDFSVNRIPGIGTKLELKLAV